MSSTTDVVVAGAGVIGCAVAHALSRRGLAVRVLDSRLPGTGATQAAAGMLAPYNEALGHDGLLALTARSLDRYDHFVQEVVADSGRDVTYRRTGTLEVAVRPETTAHLDDIARALAARDVEADRLDAIATRAAEPHLSEAVAGGLFVPCHGYVAPVQLTDALAIGARAHGVVFERAHVQRIARRGEGVIVETGTETIAAARVVLATGSWAGRVEVDGAALAPVRPVRGQLVQLQWDGPPLGRVLWSERCYVVPWDDGTVLVGATVEDVGFDERTTAAGVHDLIAAVTELIPQAWSARFVSARAGLRPASLDEMPIIGPSPAVPGLVYACGHYRNGILLAPLTAELVAGLIVDNVADPALATTSIDRFARTLREAAP